MGNRKFIVNEADENEIVRAIQRGARRMDDTGRFWHGRRRAEYKTPNGYLRIQLVIDGVRYTASAHRVAWRLFNNRGIPARRVIDHVDGNKRNNAKHNLEAITQSENVRRAIKRSRAI